MKGYLVLAFIVALAGVVRSASTGGKGDKQAVSNECLKKTGFKLEDIFKSEKNFDDRCFGKCLLTEMGFLKELKFDRDAIKADIVDNNSDKKLQGQISNYTLACLDNAEKAAGKLSDENLCKAASQFLTCCKKEEEKLK